MIRRFTVDIPTHTSHGGFRLDPKGELMLYEEYEKLFTAFRKYAKHSPDCDIHREILPPSVNCDCGLKFKLEGKL